MCSCWNSAWRLFLHFDALDLVHSGDDGDVLDGLLQLVHGVHREVDDAFDDIVLSVGLEAVHGEVLLFHEAVYDVPQQVVTVDCHDAYAHGVRILLRRAEVYGDDGVAVLGSELDGDGTVAAVDGDLAVCVLEAYYLVSGERGTLFTKDIAGVCAIAQGVMKHAACFVRLGIFEPLRLGDDVFRGADFHAVSAVELGLEGLEQTVDTGELGVLPYLRMHLERKIQRRGSLGQDDTLALGGESEDVFVVEGRTDAFHEIKSVAALCDVLKDGLEALEPGFSAFHDAAEARIAMHALRCDMQLLPCSCAIEKPHVEALVAVVLGIVYVIADASGALLEMVREAAVDEETGVFFRIRGAGPLGDGGVDDADEVLEVHVREIAVLLPLGAPDAIGAPVADLHACGDFFLRQYRFYLVREGLDDTCGADAFLLKLTFQELELPGAAEAERKVLQLRLDVVQAQAAGKRGVEEVCLSGYLHLLVRAHAVQGAHVVETVAELDEEGADVVVDGFKDLAIVVYLLGMLVVMLLALGDYVYQEGHVVSEAGADVFYGVWGVFRYVVKEGCDDGVGVQFELFCGN